MYNDFMLLSFSVAFIALILIELIRLHPWIYSNISNHSNKSNILQYILDYYIKFADEKDQQDSMILSHIYLLLGKLYYI